MRWSFALAMVLALCVGGARTASAQMPEACGKLLKVRDEVQAKGNAIGLAQKRKADRKEVCTLVTRFSNAEAVWVKGLAENASWCGIPEQIIKNSRMIHEKTVKFQVAICSEAPRPKQPTLSDAIGTPSSDTIKNTQTGHGTLDTLTGNPLGQ